MKKHCLTAALAMAVLSSALAAKEPAFEASLADGIVKVRRGDFAGSLVPLEKAVAQVKGQKGREKDEAQARRFLGVAYAALSRDEEARREFRQVLALGGPSEVPSEGMPPRAKRLFEEEASRRGRTATLAPTSAPTPASQTSGQTKRKVPVVGPLLLAGAGVGAAVALHKGEGETSTPGVSYPNYFTLLTASTSVALVDITRVHFVARESSGCKSPRWTWDLGDGTTTSTDASLTTSVPSHVYRQPGEYQVVVTAECAQGTPARGYLRIFARSLTGTWLRNGFLDAHEGIYRLIQSGATFQGDCSPCFPDEQDPFVGPISGSIEAASDDEVRIRWRQGQVDMTIAVRKPYDYIYTCIQQPRSSCFSLVRQP